MKDWAFANPFLATLIVVVALYVSLLLGMRLIDFVQWFLRWLDH